MNPHPTENLEEVVVVVEEVVVEVLPEAATLPHTVNQEQLL